MLYKDVTMDHPKARKYLTESRTKFLDSILAFHLQKYIIPRAFPKPLEKSAEEEKCLDLKNRIMYCVRIVWIPTAPFPVYSHFLIRPHFYVFFASILGIDTVGNRKLKLIANMQYHTCMNIFEN